MKKSQFLLFVLFSFILYLAWYYFIQQYYAVFISKSCVHFTSIFSDIKTSHIDNSKNPVMMFFNYRDRTTHVSIEYCMPVILLLAWHFAQFFGEIKKSTVAKYAAINFAIVYFFQMLYPLLLYGISKSQVKFTLFFLGLQCFGVLILFLIITNNLYLKIYSKK